MSEDVVTGGPAGSGNAPAEPSGAAGSEPAGTVSSEPGGAVSSEPAGTAGSEPGAVGSQPRGASTEAGTAPAQAPNATAEDQLPPGWAAFGPQPEPAPTRVRRIARRTFATVRHEWTLATVGSLLLAAALTWPALRQPTRTIPQDIYDPTLQAWQLAWSGHALTHDPGQLWHANAFYPERYSYAFSDTLLGYAPFGMAGVGPVAAVLRYNIVFVLAFALAFLGAYALVRQLGGFRTGSAVAGAAFAYSPWRLGQAGHLHVISSGGIALALAMLARGHGWSLRHGYRPDRVRPGWALAGWLVAAWQISLGFGVGLPFAYVLALIGVAGLGGWLLRRPRLRGWLILADLAGVLAFVGVAAGMAYPYLKVIALHPEARRTEAMVDFFSPPLRGFFTAPPESRIWGSAHETARASLPWAPEMAMLPGFVLYGLAAAGLIVSIWSVWQRILLTAGVVVTIVLAMGTRAPAGGRYEYLLLYRNLPGFDALRTSGRLVLWTTLLLAILAAGAVSAFARRAGELVVDRVPDRPGPLLRLATLIPLLLVLGEALPATPHPEVPSAPAAMRTAQPPILVLPTDELTDENVMLWGTDRFPAMVNGGSGFVPNGQAEIRELVQHFPDAASIDRLRRIGVKTVIVVRSRVAGTPYAGAVEAPVDGLDITREETDEAVVFTLG